MLLGNLAALVQRDVKRLLAYSAVAQAGYVLVGLAGNSAWSAPAVIYYAVTYAAGALGSFAILGVVEDEEGRVPLESLAGLSRRAPLMGGALLVFMLSMAGMPPLAGFYGKFTLFAGAVAAVPGQGLLWLVIIGVFLSAVSLYYYLLVLKQAFVVAAPESVEVRKPGGVVQVVVGVLALVVVVLGCCPQWLVQPVTEGLRAAGW
jgi:NADH-quinone oxidoreductase subunit N